MTNKNTNINWITAPRRGDNEWCGFKKTFTLDKQIESAVVRFESDCVCAVYLNGEFITSGTGRYPERVNCHEVTSSLRIGENTLELILGGHYFQKFARDTKQQRGYWLNQAALELEVSLENGCKISIATDKSFERINPDDDTPVLETMQVTKAEYETMWKNAAFWQETKNYKPEIASEVLSVAGEEYEKYANEKRPEAVCCDNIISTDMIEKDGCLTAKIGAEECYLIVDMSRLVVGFAEFEYKTSGKVSVKSMFDYSELVEDFEPNEENEYFINRLAITEDLDTKKSFYRNHRRRAFRYMKMVFSGDLKDLSVNALKVRLDLFPETEKGWFNCSDEMLNKAWEMGKYTLLVNKHQEYESCPRNEMLFFAGDGAVDAMIDIYAYGNCDLLNTSLSLQHEVSALGISTFDKFNRTVWQWDYFAWRIICIYDYYRHTGKKDFLIRHYEEAKKNMAWMQERMNDKNLLFQIPAFHSTFSTTLIQVDWACSRHRLGENAFLNCLLYKSLVCMAELAEDMNDSDSAKEWAELAPLVKEAINKYLWDEEKQSYVDGISDYICQDANAFAIIFDVADDERANKALDTVKKTLWSDYGSVMASKRLEGKLRGGNVTISPMMSTHEAEAWFKQDRAEEGLELIRRVWGTMLKKGATTFWEFTPNNADGRWEATCHAWSAGCTYLLSAFIMGVRPTAPNFGAITFAPRPCDLESAKGVVPSPEGLIAVSWEKDNAGKTKFKLALPKAIELTTDLPENSEIEVITY